MTSDKMTRDERIDAMLAETRGWRSRVRDSSVDVTKPGTHITIAGSNVIGTRTATPPAVATTPPYSDAAALSA